MTIESRQMTIRHYVHLVRRTVIAFYSSESRGLQCRLGSVQIYVWPH